MHIYPSLGLLQHQLKNEPYRPSQADGSPRCNTISTGSVAPSFVLWTTAAMRSVPVVRPGTGTGVGAVPNQAPLRT